MTAAVRGDCTSTRWRCLKSTGSRNGMSAPRSRTSRSAVFGRLEPGRRPAEARLGELGLCRGQRLLQLRFGGDAAADRRLERARNAHGAGVAVADHTAASETVFVDLEQLLLEQRRQLQVVEQQRQVLLTRQRELEGIFRISAALARARALTVTGSRLAGNGVAGPEVLVPRHHAPVGTGRRIEHETRLAHVLTVDHHIGRAVLLPELAPRNQLVDLRLEGARHTLQDALTVGGALAPIGSPVDDDGSHGICSWRPGLTAAWPWSTTRPGAAPGSACGRAPACAPRRPRASSHRPHCPWRSTRPPAASHRWQRTCASR